MMLGCAAAPVPASSGIAIQFAALEGTQACSATWNGTGTLPSGSADAIDHLTLQWRELDTGQTATLTISAADVAGNGTWSVGTLPVSNQLQLQVYACTVDNRVVWYGKGSDFVVKQGEETSAQLFMTPPGKLACMGRNGVGTGLQTPRAFAGGTALASGDAIVVGGADKWDGTLATASAATDFYDYRLGQWRPGPSLQAPRIWPQVLPVDATHVLVAGGSAHLDQTAMSLPLTLFAPHELPGAGGATPLIELLDVNAGSTLVPTTGLEAATMPLTGAAVAGGSLVFVGGLGAGGVALGGGVRVALPLGAPVQGTPLHLAVGRIQPNVLSYSDGAVVVWGGQPSKLAANFGELLAKDATSGTLLQVSGAQIVSDPNAQTIGAAAVVLAEQGDVLTFLVTGGIPVNTGWATATPSYTVVVDRAHGTAVCSKVALPSGAALPGGLGIAATRLDGGYVLLSGGLLSLSKLQAADDPASQCQTDDQVKNGCLVNGFLLLQPIVDPAAGVVTPVKLDTLAAIGGRFGQIALPLPVGALLTGGLQGIQPPVAATETFDAAAQIVSAPFATSAGQAACKP